MRISDESTAKERPEDPAPWWKMKSGDLEVGAAGELRYAWWVMLVVGDLRWRSRSK